MVKKEAAAVAGTVVKYRIFKKEPEGSLNAKLMLARVLVTTDLDRVVGALVG